MTVKKPAPTKAARPAAKAKPAAVEPKKKAPAAKAAEPVKAKGPAPKKGKVDEKLAKGDTSDVDLSDLESDLEGEPVPAEVEAAAKAKPLRIGQPRQGACADARVR